jgi:DksA/TraR C4-type zinc finger protein
MTTTESRCVECERSIPAARLAAMPGTRWCVRCADSRTERIGGNMVWSHKTAPELELRPLSEAREWHRRYDRRRATANISVGSYARAQDAAMGINPFEGE